MNLIGNKLYNYALPWGNSPASPYVCNFSEDQVCFNAHNQLCLNTKKIGNWGWYMDDLWVGLWRLRPYECGMVVSKEKFGFGMFEFEFTLPKERGSWPAIWLLDIDKKVNILPEIDIMEQFVKNCWWKHKLSLNYQDGPSYENNRTRGKTLWGLFPWHRKPINIKLLWNKDYLQWIFDGGVELTVDAKEMNNFPVSPMNLIINSGVGDWKPKDNISPFIITKAEYTKL